LPACAASMLLTMLIVSIRHPPSANTLPAGG
jgi:hypothetical protein